MIEKQYRATVYILVNGNLISRFYNGFAVDKYQFKQVIKNKVEFDFRPAEVVIEGFGPISYKGR